jgi:hypothetical protein
MYFYSMVMRPKEYWIGSTTNAKRAEKPIRNQELRNENGSHSIRDTRAQSIRGYENYDTL